MYWAKGLKAQRLEAIFGLLAFCPIILHKPDERNDHSCGRLHP